MPEETPEEPKLIIDDDWKERVQSEKEAAAAAAAEKAAGAEKSQTAADHASSDAATPVDTPPGAATTDEPPSPDLPPASFATLVHSLTAQALASLGQIPDPEGKANVELELGKHFIDTLAVLEEKTKGNLDEDESAALSKMLYELRMLFVHVRNEQRGGATPQEDPSNLHDPGY